MKLPRPFAYPKKPHVRRHGPKGYSRYGKYRNWLRDEFSFRCIYCLRRETWFSMPRDFELDHFLPKSTRRDIANDYDNLVLACRQCNGTKAAKLIPSPEQIAYADCLRVDNEGVIHAKNEDGAAIIEAMRLDSPEFTSVRRDIIQMVNEARSGSTALRRLLGYPEVLPNLSDEEQPRNNTKPAGVRDSFFERHRRGELSDYFEY